MAGVFKSLDKSDIRLTPFRAYKQYIDTRPSASYTTYSAELSTTPIELGNDPLDSVSSYYTTNGKLKDSVWRVTNHLFYRDFYTNTKATFGSSDLNKQSRLLNKDAVVISIPQSNFGESVAYNTFNCVINSVVYTDDIYGNLIRSSSRWASAGEISASNVVFNLKPQVLTSQVTTTISSSLSYYTDLYPATVQYNNITVSDHPTSGTYLDLTPTGAITLQPYSSDINQKYNFTNADYGIYVSFLNSISGSGNFSILEKKAQTEVFGVDINGNVLTNNIYRYPYSLTYSSESNKFRFEKSNGYETLVYTSSLVATAAKEVLLTRSGSTYFLRHSTTIDTFSDTLSDRGCTNQAPIYIGNNEQMSSGSNLQITNTVFFDNYITGSMFTSLTTNLPKNDPYKIVGNVFHKHGIITITDPSLVALIQSTPSTLSTVVYRGTTTIYENEISCTVSPNEFGLSNNPTLHQYNAIKNQYEFKPFITSSDFRPFVTQVGLYDDYGNLLVVGKLTQPIQLPSNVDTTFIIRYDR
jgi:hypothetical protein